MQVMHNRQVPQFKYVTPRETKKHVPNVETVDWDDLSNLDYLTTILKRYSVRKEYIYSVHKELKNKSFPIHVEQFDSFLEIIELALEKNEHIEYIIEILLWIQLWSIDRSYFDRVTELLLKVIFDHFDSALNDTIYSTAIQALTLSYIVDTKPDIEKVTNILVSMLSNYTTDLILDEDSENLRHDIGVELVKAITVLTCLHDFEDRRIIDDAFDSMKQILELEAPVNLKLEISKAFVAILSASDDEVPFSLSSSILLNLGKNFSYTEQKKIQKYADKLETKDTTSTIKLKIPTIFAVHKEYARGMECSYHAKYIIKYMKSCLGNLYSDMTTCQQTTYKRSYALAYKLFEILEVEHDIQMNKGTDINDVAISELKYYKFDYVDFSKKKNRNKRRLVQNELR